MINAFEAEYPYSVDQYMYEIYSKELKKRANKRKRRNKRKKISKELKASVKFLSKKKKMEFFSKSELKEVKFLSKKKKMEFFSKSELKEEFFDKLKVHLHLNIIQRHSKAQEKDVVIDLSLSTFESEENDLYGEPNEENMNTTEGKNNLHQLIMPIME